jgi:hypothetical protein
MPERSPHEHGLDLELQARLELPLPPYLWVAGHLVPQLAQRLDGVCAAVQRSQCGAQVEPQRQLGRGRGGGQRGGGKGTGTRRRRVG